MKKLSHSLLVVVFLVFSMLNNKISAEGFDEKKEVIASGDMCSVVNIGDYAIPTPLSEKSEMDEDTISTENIGSIDAQTSLYVNLSNQGAVYMEKGCYEEAVDVLKKAIELKPEMHQAYINLANTYYHMEKYRDSINASKAALNINPDDARAYGNLGNAYYALGKKRKAKESYQNALELFKKEKNYEGVRKIKKYLKR